MPVRYHRYGRNNVRVSRKWLVVLQAADRAGVGFTVNSGHRTIREQTALFQQNMQFVRGRWVPKPGRPLTAWPSPTAPHIRLGRAAHALDVDTRDGGEQRLENWLDAQGVNAENTVRGEAWHLELDTRELNRLYRRHRKDRRPAVGLRLSARGLAMIKRFEGLRLRAYKAHPSERWWTIGYGDYGPHVKPGQVITEREAEQRLRRRLVSFEQDVRRVGVPLTQAEYDAAVSFVYNLGPGVLEPGRTFGRYLRARAYRRAGAAMRLYVFSGGEKLPGLVRRRAVESRLFLSGRYR